MIYRKIKNKLAGKQGESLAETLAALLISSFAMMMLAGSIQASSNLVQKSRETLGAYYDRNEAEDGVAKMSGEGIPVWATIKMAPGSADGVSERRKVSVFTNDTFSRTPVYSYRPEESDSP